MTALADPLVAVTPRSFNFNAWACQQLDLTSGIAELMVYLPLFPPIITQAVIIVRSGLGRDT